MTRITTKATVRLIEPRGRPLIECPKCRTTVVWPSELTLLAMAPGLASRD
jgi:hypothetical protein